MNKFSQGIPQLISLVEASFEDDFYDTIEPELNLKSATEMMVINLAEQLDKDLIGPVDQDKINMFVMIGNLLVENFLLNVRHQKSLIR